MINIESHMTCTICAKIYVSNNIHFSVYVPFVVLEIWFVTPDKFLPSPVDGADKKSQLDTLETRSPPHFSQNAKWNTLRQVLI